MLAKLTNFQMIQWVEGNHLTKSPDEFDHTSPVWISLKEGRLLFDPLGLEFPW